MRARTSVAFLMIFALAAMCGSDLFARARGCGPHPCCAKGACKMMPKGGARFDRCGETDPTNAPQSPMLLTSVGGFVIAVVTIPSAAAITPIITDGASFAVDRPPR